MAAPYTSERLAHKYHVRPEPALKHSLGRQYELWRLLYAGGCEGNSGLRGAASYHSGSGDRDARALLRAPGRISAVRLRLPDLLERALQPERHELRRRRFLPGPAGDDVLFAGRAHGGDGTVSRPLHSYWRRRGEFRQLE